ncbi:MAG: glycosyltransferase family 2 protein [Haloplanus sp.]
MARLTTERESAGIVLIVFFSFGLLYHLISPGVFFITATVGVGAAVLGLLPVLLTKSGSTASKIALLALLGVVVLPLGYGAFQLDWDLLSPISLVLLVALAFVFFFYSVFLPLALLHVHRRELDPELEPPYPSVSVIVPAYNEEECIGASIKALQRTSYPRNKKEIIVVDDGSTDATYQKAKRQADETVRILQKSNGGKYTALNHGLDSASGEIIVTVDADSLLDTDTLERVAGIFQQERAVGAIAGNLTVANRDSFITKLQELEYIIGIQLFRRAYDAVETVVVVPGAFGAYRREILDRVGGFDGDTLTEDRDATVKILKAGKVTRASEALCHTEAPETWTDLYKQRLRWYRGTVQTLLKHRDVFRTPGYGYLYSLAFPMEAFTAIVVPVVGIAVIISIIAELVVGSVVRVASLFVFFTLLQTLVSVLALRIGDNDSKLAVYAPLFVLGYRQFLDAVMLKSLKDVVTRQDLGWTSPDRTGRLSSALEDEKEQTVDHSASVETDDWTD